MKLQKLTKTKSPSTNLKLLNEFLKKDTGKSQRQKLFLTFKGRIETGGIE